MSGKEGLWNKQSWDQMWRGKTELMLGAPCWRGCGIRLAPRKEREKVKVKLLSCVPLFGTPWTVAYQASPSMGFSRQEYQNVFPFPFPGDLPDPGIEPASPAPQAEALPSELPGKSPREDASKSK